MARRSWVVVLALLGLSLLSAVALGARQGGVLRIRAMDLQNIDPMKLLGRNDDIHVASQIFDSLVILGKDDFLPKPELATSWELVDDTTWIFHLREGAMFQDDNEVFPKGQAREVVADDVVYSIQRAKELAPNLNLASITSVRAIDRYTVEVKTSVPEPLLLDVNRLSSVMIVPREAVEKLGEAFATRPVGSGPFKLVSFVPGEEAILKRNEAYWLPVNLDEVHFIVIPDPSAAVIALEAGEIDVIPYGPADEGPRLVQQGFQLSKRGGSFRGLGFNVTAAPFDDWRVREGISRLLDVDSAWQAVIPAGFGERAYGQVPPWVPFGYDPEGLKDLDVYDPEGGLRLLAEAGWADHDGDGFLDKDGKRLVVEVKTFPGAQVRVITILVTQLKQQGIDARILQLDVSAWVDDLLSGRTTVFFDFSYAGSTGLYSMFHSSMIGKSNTHFYRNANVDDLLDRASRSMDYDERSQLWKQAQRQVIEDRVIIPLYFEWTTNYVSPRVQEWVSPWGGLQIVSIENNVWLK
ncbi:ABC transporter substrate-binding protein [Candidatus Bipolaricaulota bacterium]|nr:ABC transporter substrate-binding protein [Candidatus Bipolaricaulota bacterium]